MADVRTEGLNTADTSTSNLTPNQKMTVEKLTGQTGPPASKNRTTQAKGSSNSSNSEASTVSPTQLKVAPGNNPPVSPKKNDPKTSPTSKASGGAGVQPQPRLQAQQVSKNKGNPWHKNPMPPSSGAGSKKGTTSSPEAKAINETASSTQTRDGVPSKSISIPKDQVCVVGCACLCMCGQPNRPCA